MDTSAGGGQGRVRARAGMERVRVRPGEFGRRRWGYVSYITERHTELRFLHASFSAPAEFVNEEHVILAWAVLRARHPVLGCLLVETSSTSWNFR